MRAAAVSRRLAYDLLFLAILSFRTLPAAAQTTAVVEGRATAFAQVRTVVAIHWGPADFPSTPTMNTAIRQTFGASAVTVDYFPEYLDVSERFPMEPASLALADYIRAKYRGRCIDLVIAFSNPALQFALDHHDDLFHGVPIVFGATPLEDNAALAARRATGIRVAAAYSETLKLALQLHPATQRVFVVAKSPDRAGVEAVSRALRGYEDRVRVTYVDEDSVPRLVAAIKAVPPRSLVLYIWHWQEDPGSATHTDTFAPLVAAASPVPVYGTSDLYPGSGIVGGVLRPTAETGHRLAELALQILNGARAEDIPIENARLVPTFDWRQLQRWGIDASRLPPGSDIQFRTPGAWESYRPYFVATLAVMAGQLLLITGLVTQRARRRRAEQTVRLREATLRDSYQRIRQLAGGLITSQESTRAAIACELHDHVGQALVGLSMAVGSLKRSFGHGRDTQMRAALSDLEQQALGVVDRVRRLSRDLHPATLALVGLPAALKTHCIEVEQRHDVQVSLATGGDLERIDPELALSLFRIAQEALRNAAVHGDARRLAVDVARAPADGRITLTVIDDGCGFDLEGVRRNGCGLGLLTMEERARLIAGTLSINTSPGAGTVIRVQVLAAADSQGADDSARVRDVHVPADGLESS
jgi:signal transduction histidine kinase